MSPPRDRVLVLDDDPMQLELVQRGLAGNGFEVRGVTSVAELALEARQRPPAIMLIDVNLPDTSGAEVVAIARNAAPEARIVLYSAWEDSRLRVLAAELGADGYLSKSESVVAIGRRLRELVR